MSSFFDFVIDRVGWTTAFTPRRVFTKVYFLIAWREADNDLLVPGGRRWHYWE